MKNPLHRKQNLHTPQHEEPAQQITDAIDKLIVVSTPYRNHKNRRRERGAALIRSHKAQRSSEQKVAAAETFLANITNQAAAWPRKKVWSSYHPARLAYKAARRTALENEALEEAAALAVAFQGRGYTKRLTEQQIKRATINRTIPTAASIPEPPRPVQNQKRKKCKSRNVEVTNGNRHHTTKREKNQTKYLQWQWGT